MTRQEFIDTITDFYELREFANDNGLYESVEDLLDYEELDEEVDNEVTSLARSESWQTVRDVLDEVPTCDGWYIRTGYLSYEEASNYDFEILKRDVLEAADDEDVWGDEDDDEDDDDGDEGDEEDELDDDYDPDSVVLALFGAKAS